LLIFFLQVHDRGMKLELLALCDAATESGGKLNILGAFDTLHAVQQPIRHPACAVVVRIRFSTGEEGQYDFRLRFIDCDGQRIGRADLQGNVNVRFPQGTETAVVNLIVNIQNIEFPTFGEHRIDLLLNEELIGALPLFVRKLIPHPPGH
jgi:hypothetical protein